MWQKIVFQTLYLLDDDVKIELLIAFYLNSKFRKTRSENQQQQHHHSCCKTVNDSQCFIREQTNIWYCCGFRKSKTKNSINTRYTYIPRYRVWINGSNSRGYSRPVRTNYIYKLSLSQLQSIYFIIFHLGQNNSTCVRHFPWLS